nr:hypothetical protein [Candidatus Sigynarchaeota archaeon]
MRKIPGRASDATTFVMRVYSLACAILGGTWCFGLAGLMWQHPDMFTVEPWYQLVLGILYVSISLFGYFLSNHRIVVAILVPLSLYLAMMLVWMPYMRLARVFWGWGFFGVVQAVFGIFACIGIGFSILHIIFVGVRQFKERQGTTDYDWFTGSFVDMGRAFMENVKKYKKVHLGFAVILATSWILSTAFQRNWFIPANATVTLHPADYQIKFQFYGPSSESYYNATELDSMNRLGVRIIDHVTSFIMYDNYSANPTLWWMNLTDYKQTTDYHDKRDMIVARYSPWKTNWPNVTFIYQITGIPGFFPTDYAVTSGYWGVGALLMNAWLTLEVIVEENLTNVVGLHTDQEDVSESWPPIAVGSTSTEFEVTRDQERNMQARQNYLEFFQRVRNAERTNQTWKDFVIAMNSSYGIDHFLFTTTYGSEVLDGLDNDWDMDVFNMNNVNTLPYDEFLPMLYNQHRFPPDNAHYALYMQMSVLHKTLETAGYPGRIGALLGCMAASGSMFLPNYTGTQLVNGNQVDITGFDVVARQVMIVKSFNCTWVSFFPLNEYTGEGFWGIFKTFGDTFFDDLNAMVNAANASAPYSIRYCPNVSEMEMDLARDLFLSAGWEWYYLVALISAFAGVWLHHTLKPRVKAKQLEQKRA